jgi:hypothetical protein
MLQRDRISLGIVKLCSWLIPGILEVGTHGAGTLQNRRLVGCIYEDWTHPTNSERPRERAGRRMVGCAALTHPTRIHVCQFVGWVSAAQPTKWPALTHPTRLRPGPWTSTRGRTSPPGAPSLLLPRRTFPHLGVADLRGDSPDVLPPNRADQANETGPHAITSLTTWKPRRARAGEAFAPHLCRGQGHPDRGLQRRKQLRRQLEVHPRAGRQNSATRQ